MAFTMGEVMLKSWEQEMEKSTRFIYRTFGSSQNCNTCYFCNKYRNHLVCRYHFIGIPPLAFQFKCSHWSKK